MVSEDEAYSEFVELASRRLWDQAKSVSSDETLLESSQGAANPALWWLLRGTSCYFTADFIEARRCYARAIELDERYYEAHLSLAYLLACCPDQFLWDGEMAVRLAIKACRLAGAKRWEPLLVLSAAYARSGNFVEARRAALAASSVVPDDLSYRVTRVLEHIAAKKPVVGDLERDFHQLRWGDEGWGGSRDDLS